MLDELSRYRSPDPVPEQEEIIEEVEQEQPQEGENKPGFMWVGDPNRPEAQKSSDGISDLFDPGTEDDTSDLISVDMEGDIIDANPETGDLSDLVDVSEADILGDDETGQVPLDYHPDQPRRRTLPRYRRIPQRYVPPTSARGLGG